MTLVGTLFYIDNILDLKKMCFAGMFGICCYVYLVTELNGITDNVTLMQRRKSSIKFYIVINQNTVISNNRNINSCLNLHKTIPVITVEEKNS